MVSSVNTAYEVSKDPWLSQPYHFFFNQGKKDKVKSPSSAKETVVYLKKEFMLPINYWGVPTPTPAQNFMPSPIIKSNA